MMLYTMVELIHTLSYIKDKKITLLPLSPTDIIKHANEIKNKPPTDIAKNNGIKLKGGAFLDTAELCDNPDAPCYTMFCQPFMSGALPAVTNLLQELLMIGWSRGRLQFYKEGMMRASPRWSRGRLQFEQGRMMRTSPR